MIIWAIESLVPDAGWCVVNTFRTEPEATERLEWMNQHWPDLRRRIARYQRLSETQSPDNRT